MVREYYGGAVQALRGSPRICEDWHDWGGSSTADPSDRDEARLGARAASRWPVRAAPRSPRA